MYDLTLITLTGDRPEAFALTQQYMRRALGMHRVRHGYEPKVNWIVVDDGEDPAMFAEFCPESAEIIRLEPRPGENTMVRNLTAALDAAQRSTRKISGKVLIIEDDDWYDELYVVAYSRLLDEADIVGENRAIYYNVASREFMRCGNVEHASLCQTGFRACLIPFFLKILREQPENPFIDIPFWIGARIEKSARMTMVTNRYWSVGIKGMPGRPGIGSGHRPRQCHGQQWTPDPTLLYLAQLIGAKAADNYAAYFNEGKNDGINKDPLVERA